jgi:hypothetical protein
MIAQVYALKMTPDDEMSVEKCIGVLLCSNSLEHVRYLTSTQKCEAFNRTLERCNPKNVTHSRNFPGRAHTAIHWRNHRFGNSTLLQTKALIHKLCYFWICYAFAIMFRYFIAYRSMQFILSLPSHRPYLF